MAKNEKQDFAAKTNDELRKLLGEKREALRQFRFSMKGSRTRNTKQGAAYRKDIARILTALGAKGNETEAH